jgi:hypothetical protein
LLTLAGVLLSTSAAKLSFPGGWSDFAGFWGATGKATLVAASVVTLNTGGLSGMELALDQQGPGHPEGGKIYIYFNVLHEFRVNYGAARAAPFSARRQDLPPAPKQNSLA